MSDSATLSYQYYPDGTKEAVGVSSTTFTYSQMKQYSYRVDGKLQTLGFQPTNQTIAYGYTNAGRPASGGGADNSSYSYTNGTLSGYTIAANNTQVISDAEGSTTELLPQSATGSYPPQMFVYNSRNEVVDNYLLPPDINNYNRVQRYHDGAYAVPITTYEHPLMRQAYPLPTSAPITYDSLNGVLIGHSSTTPDVAPTPIAGAPIPHSPPDTSRDISSSDQYGFDIQGRQITHSGNQRYHHYEATDDCYQTNSSTTTRGYDFENHLVSQDSTKTSNIGVCNVTPSTTTDYGATALTWSPDEHPILETSVPIGSGGTTTNFTLHWDNDELLFVTDTAANLTIAHLDTAGYYQPLTSLLGTPPNNSTMLILTDRDPAGNEITSAGVAYQPDSSLNATTTMPRSSFSYIRSDGVDLGTFDKNTNNSDTAPGGGSTPNDSVTVQGGRVYDSQMGSWTTPDAYKGEVDDPASMERYMWNGDNAMTYSDPSGFCPFGAFICNATGGIGLTAGANGDAGIGAAAGMGGNFQGGVALFKNPSGFHVDFFLLGGGFSTLPGPSGGTSQTDTMPAGSGALPGGSGPFSAGLFGGIGLGGFVTNVGSLAATQVLPASLNVNAGAGKYQGQFNLAFAKSSGILSFSPPNGGLGFGFSVSQYAQRIIPIRDFSIGNF